jgi:hypothetical protein
MAAFAQREADFETGTTADGTGIVIKGYRGMNKAVKIPAFIKGIAVREIAANAFQHETTITSVEIPRLVTSIGGGAFYRCSSLTRVIILARDMSIGDGAFRGCSSLSAFTVDSGNPAYSSQDGVLFNNTKTTLIAYPWGKSGAYTIPAGVTSIGDRAFYYCSSLTGVTIPAGVTSIREGAFSQCSSLTGVTIPASVTSIGRGAFWGCGSLTGVTIPASVTSIGENAFRECRRLTRVTFAAGSAIKEFGDVAFPYGNFTTTKSFNGLQKAYKNGGAGTYTLSGDDWTKQ